MDGFMTLTHTEYWRSYIVAGELRGTEQSSNDQTELTHLQNNPQPDAEAAAAAASTGKKRKGRKPTQTLAEKRTKKIASDRNHRRGLKDKFQRLMKIASECGGTNEMESEFQRLKQMKSKYGGFEEIESKLNKHEQMEAESAVFEQVKTMFGGIHNIVPGLDRLKRTEFQHTVFKPNQMDRPFIDFLPPSPDSFQYEYNHGAQSVNPNNQGSSSDSDWLGDYGICHMFLAVETTYSDGLVTDFISTLEKNARSNVNFSSFKDLDGERQKDGDYSFPKSLISTVKAIKAAHGDVTKNCLLGPCVVENTYVLLCAAIKEMGDLSLKQVTEEIILKWRDAIKDAKRIGFDVEFAWEHLETIAYAYFGLKARNYRSSLEQRMGNLVAAEKSLRQKLEHRAEELKAVKAKEEELTSSQCKKCLDCADQFLNKNVGLLG